MSFFRRYSVLKSLDGMTFITFIRNNGFCFGFLSKFGLYSMKGINKVINI